VPVAVPSEIGVLIRCENGAREMADPLEVLPSMASQADMGFKLVGGFKHFLFSIIQGMSSFPLTFILFKMVIAPPTRQKCTPKLWMVDLVGHG